jgi:hypothetical protein
VEDVDVTGRITLERAARGWIAALPPGVAAVEEQETEAGLFLALKPAKAGAMHVAVGFGQPETVGLYWGTDFRVEELTSDPDLLVRVLQAVRNGRVSKEVWTVWGRVASILSVIEDQELLASSRVVNLLWLLRPLARRASRRTYLPWDTNLSE